MRWKMAENHWQEHQQPRLEDDMSVKSGGGKLELCVVLLGVVIGAIAYQLDWRPGEYVGTLLAAVSLGILLARRAGLP
jgi:Kef-type K+ transport system membrane component KefB